MSGPELTKRSLLGTTRMYDAPDELPLSFPASLRCFGSVRVSSEVGRLDLVGTDTNESMVKAFLHVGDTFPSHSIEAQTMPSEAFDFPSGTLHTLLDELPDFVWT